MQLMEINGVGLHVALHGDPGGHPLVFVNALGTDFRIWDRLVPLLPAGLRILRYDMRGHGLSDAPVGDYWMGDLVAEAAGLMDALGMRAAMVVGVSLGGIVAQGLAAERPDLVRAVVLSNTAAKIGTEAAWRERITTVRREGIAAIADATMEKWFPRAYRTRHGTDVGLWRAMVTRTPLDGYCGCCAALADTDLRDSTASLRQPVQVIAGDQDGSTPPDLVREMAESIVGARYTLIRGAGHLPAIDAPQDVALLLAHFLDATAG